MTKNTPHSFVDLTPDQWDLYADEKGAQEAAVALNTKLNQEIRNVYVAQSEGMHLHEAIKEMRTRMDESLLSFASLGGGESGPAQALERQMSRFFGADCAEVPRGHVDGKTFVAHDADGWDLFSDRKGAKEAAAVINNSFNDEMTKAFVAMADGTPRHVAAKAMREAVETTMQNIEGFGASDTEPRTILWREMGRVLGDNCEDEPKAARRPGPR